MNERPVVKAAGLFFVMKTYIEISGTIIFDPRNSTKKHERQSPWKRMAMVMLDGGTELTSYYAWFIKQRYGIRLNKTLRGAHISFINDHIRDIAGNNEFEKQAKWEEVRSKYNNKRVKVVVDVDARTNGDHWWFVVPEEHRGELHGIRQELGMGRPHYGLHMTIGYPNEYNIDHSRYIHNLLMNSYTY